MYAVAEVVVQTHEVSLGEWELHMVGTCAEMSQVHCITTVL